MLRKDKLFNLHIFAITFLVLACIAIYYKVLGHQFLFWDDAFNIFDNPDVHPPSFIKTLSFWGKSQHNLYIPMTYTIWSAVSYFAQDNSPFGISAFPFHFLNLIVHITNVLLVYFILRLILRFKQKKQGDSIALLISAAMGALLFACHPFQVESLGWITAFKDVHFVFWALLSILSYLIFILGNTKKHRQNTYYILAILFYILALLSKPTAVMLPVLLCILNIYFLKRSLKKSIFELVPWIALIFPFALITIFAQQVAPSYILPIWTRPFVMGDTYSYYLYKLFFPIWMAPDYTRAPSLIIDSGWAYITWIVIPVLLIFGWHKRKTYAWFLGTLLFFCFSILPVSGLIPFHYQYHSTVADRFMYFSMFGVALGFSFFLMHYKSKTVFGVAAIILIFFSIKSWNQTKYWKSDKTLFEYELQLYPKSYLAYLNLGSALTDLHQYNEAIDLYKKALSLNPNHSKIHLNLGTTYYRAGRLEDALFHYQEAARLEPNFGSAYHNIKLVLRKLREQKEVETGHQ